jgi:AcrR family transcriptional regulator
VSGLRERKKLQTRQHIADVAARLFAEHGYVAVTVEQVAQAADVAKKTVFNYFPTKEDLVFERAEAGEEDLITLLGNLPPGAPILDAFRADVTRHLDDVAGREPGFQHGSPLELAKTNRAVRRRMLEIAEIRAMAVSDAVAARRGVAPDDPEAGVVARTLLAAQQAVFHEVHRQLDAGATPKDAADAARPIADRMFALVATGLADYPRTENPDADRLAA